MQQKYVLTAHLKKIDIKGEPNKNEAAWNFEMF